MAVLESSRLSRGGGSNRGDRLFSAVVLMTAAIIPLLLTGIFVLLLLDALPAVQRYGLGFLATSDWDPVAEKFGAAAYIFGTVVTADNFVASPVPEPGSLLLVGFGLAFGGRYLRRRAR